MKIRIILFVSIAILFASCGETENTDSNKLSKTEWEEIVTILMETQDAWNNADLEEFMKGYWMSDELVFTGVGGPTYGYNKTLERYKQAYPDKETMGILKFTVKDLHQIDTNTAIMIGQFYLSRSIGDMVGHFTLVWQKIDGEWLIISDHSSGQTVK